MIKSLIRLAFLGALIFLLTSMKSEPLLPDNQATLSGWIKDLVIMNRLDDVDRLRRIYPEKFTNLDLCRGFYDAGISFYNGRKRMLALKVFLKGSLAFQESPYKEQCMLYSARIYYQENKRESALFYVNRALEKGGTDIQFLEDAKRLKRMIRWEYIDSSVGLPDNSISAIEFDGDDLWIGLWTGGICRFTRSSGILTIYEVHSGSLVSGNIRCIAATGEKIWVGTYEGLFSLDKKREDWTREKGELGNVPIKQLKVLGGELYAATLGSGLFVRDGITSRWKMVFNLGTQVSDILLSGNSLYIATLDKGLYILKNGNKLNILSDCSPKSICMHRGLLWVGTHGDGIFLLDSKNKIINHLRRSNGLTSDYIESVRNIKNSMFIGTLGGGAMSYNCISHRWSSISILDGLPSDDVVDINFERDRIWFGTLSGGIGILLTENFDDI